jgi:hypothetical protein
LWRRKAIVQQPVIFELVGASGSVRVESLGVESGMVRYRVTASEGETRWGLEMHHPMLAQPALGYSADNLRRAAAGLFGEPASSWHPLVKFDWDDPDFSVGLVGREGSDYLVTVIPEFWQGSTVLEGAPAAARFTVPARELEHAASQLDAFARSIGWE